MFFSTPEKRAAFAAWRRYDSDAKGIAMALSKHLDKSPDEVKQIMLSLVNMKKLSRAVGGTITGEWGTFLEKLAEDILMFAIRMRRMFPDDYAKVVVYAKRVGKNPDACMLRRLSNK